MTISDVIVKIHQLCGGTSSTSYTAANMLIDINNAYEKVVGTIMCQDGNWEFDDSNFTDFPRAKADLVAAQNDYSFDSSHLAIESVMVLNASGNYELLQPISKDEMGVPPEEFEETDGMPKYYDKDGSSVLLYPAPAAANVTTTDGLQVHFRRTADLFTSAEVTTGTKVPGFASPYHMIIAYEAAIAFNLVYKPARVPNLKVLVDQMYEDLLRFYAKREKDVRTIMSTNSIRYR